MELISPKGGDSRQAEHKIESGVYISKFQSLRSLETELMVKVRKVKR